jgi:hypothetical protein
VSTEGSFLQVSKISQLLFEFMLLSI